MSVLDGLSKSAELKKRLIFVVAMIAVFRLGSHVPTPGVDASVMTSFFGDQDKGKNLFGFLNTFTGGALSRFSVFALGIMPYITSSIIMSLLQTVVPYFESLKKEGEPGRKKLNQLTRYGTVILAFIQGYGISTFILNSDFNGQPLVVSPEVGWLGFRAMTILTLTAGTCFIMWLGEQISERGIGNGASLIIFAGIVSDMPSAVIGLVQQISTNDKSGIEALVVLVIIVAVVASIIFLEVSQRRIPVQYSQRGGAGGMAAQQNHFLPIKINPSGVIPPIFASSLLMFPATMAQFISLPWLMQMKDSIAPGGAMYNILFVALIFFFTFFYTDIVFNPVDVSDNLKKYGGFIPGVRAGKSTSDYIQRVTERINVGGAIYLSVVCVLPTILIQKLNVPFYFGGTGLLIVVGVALDTTQQIYSHLLSSKYQGLVKGVKLRGRRVQF
ncbi:MAG: preprotein translocase subunit SecY [Pseudomonadota bacterium]|nr:preprotein translocase subunit SecY [Pseudomonadota bacterium]